MDEGMEHAVTDASEDAHGGHGSGADLPLNPAPVEYVMKRLDSPGKRMAAGAGAIVFLLAFFAFAYAMGLGSMKNSEGVSRDAAVAAEKIATAQPEAPAASYTPPQTTSPTGLTTAVSTAAVTPAVETPAEVPTITATSVDSPDTASSSSDAVLSGAAESQLPAQWKTAWTGSGASVAGSSWRGPTFALKGGFVRCNVKFTTSGGAVTVYLVRVSPGIGKWALLEGSAVSGTSMTSDPRTIEEGTYRLQVDGTASFKAIVQQ